MKVRYFEATDTLLIEFNDSEVWETVEINQNTYADYARDGQVVTLTLEHARQSTDVNSVLFAKVPA
ncbi:MAG: DUF2283 domain-containing protein [Chloroflexi bacterium]|nr:DUF2283 domain-containing protein [Chloroflexota bacterium]